VTTLSLGNLAIYSAQGLLVVTAATVGARVVAPSAPRPRLAFWRAVVVACLLLPLWPTRRIDVATTFSPAIATTEMVRQEPGATEPFSRAPLGLIPWLLLAGAAARGAWLTIGVLQLRRLRMRGAPAVLDDDVEALKRVLAPHAELRWDEHIDQPLTFGLRRPIVLLPRRLTDLPPDAQRAVVCHELVHVARHDWAWTLIEEAVQTAFWFHPAMWWALGEVQLSREETVDERVVAVTGVRRPYMNALLMFAEARPAPAPAIPAVRRRHLTSRIKRLSQETVMSPARLAFVVAALVIVVVGSSLGVVSTIPLHASTPASTTAQATATAGPRLKPTLSEPMNIHFANTPLTDMIGFLCKANGIGVTYEEGLVDLLKVIAKTVKIEDATFDEALTQILTANQLSYRVLDEHSIRVERRVR
jgi:beta-lactamase regulating signal transducer with metallopeptidase domain